MSQQWVADEEALNCMQCHKKFTIFFRRHHCRSCGRVVCGPCSKQKAQVHGYDGEVRICGNCYQKIRSNSQYQDNNNNNNSNNNNNNNNNNGNNNNNNNTDTYYDDNEDSQKDYIERTTEQQLRRMSEIAAGMARMKIGALNLDMSAEKIQIAAADECLEFKWPSTGAVRYNHGTFNYFIHSNMAPEIQIGLALYMEYEIRWEPSQTHAGLIIVHRSAGEVVNRLDTTDRAPRPEAEAISFLVTAQGDFVRIASDLTQLLDMTKRAFYQHLGGQVEQDKVERMTAVVLKSTCEGVERDVRQLWQNMVQAWKVLPRDPAKLPPAYVVGELGQLFGENIWELQQNVEHDSKHLLDVARSVIAGHVHSEEEPSIKCTDVSANHWMSVLTDCHSLRPFVVKTDSSVRLTLSSFTPEIQQDLSANLTSRTLSMAMFFWDDFPLLHVQDQSPRQLQWNELLAAYIDECSAKYEVHLDKLKRAAAAATASTSSSTTSSK